MIRRPPRSTLFPTRRSSDLGMAHGVEPASLEEALARDGSRFTAAFIVSPTYYGMCADVKGDRKSTRLNSSHANISYAVFCLKKKKRKKNNNTQLQFTNVKTS